ncbi:MAG: SUMF1/EgtB/PvdO family nonheme iron enzyme [Myxococcota bacterium]
MSVISAAGIHVRHAVSRALATVNRAPMEATWRVLSSRVQLDAKGRVTQGEVTLRVEEARAIRPGDASLVGLVNPDGNHPLMAVVAGTGLLMDVFPVTWDRWLRANPEVTMPPDLDPWCPRTGIHHAGAVAYARAVGKRLPTADEFRAAWGTELYPWGPRPAPEQGRAAAPRFGELPEVGMHPPGRSGFFDLGAWLHQWTAEGQLLGGLPGLVPAEHDAEPCGFRCVQEV